VLVAVEEVRSRLRQKLEAAFGMEEAAMLMDRPPGDLVTNAALDQRLAAFKHELVGEMHREFRDQTWKLVTAMLAAMGTLVGAMGIFIALAKL
jgi:hypothetical protein